jgi:hypothetical protein
MEMESLIGQYHLGPPCSSIREIFGELQGCVNCGVSPFEPLLRLNRAYTRAWQIRDGVQTPPQLCIVQHFSTMAALL